jgi:uncharacterized phage-associated protein
MPNINAIEMAHYILGYASKKQIPITNLKLQKLLFFCQGWYLASKGSLLFDENFEAWPKGPAIYDVWSAFKGFGKNPIAVLPKDIYLNGDEDMVNNVLDIYAPIDEWVLVRMSHGKSWNAARGNLPANAHSRNRIKFDLLGLEFRELAAEKKAITSDPEDSPDDEPTSSWAQPTKAGDIVTLSATGDSLGLVVSQQALEIIGERLNQTDKDRAKPLNVEEMRQRLGLDVVGHA